MRSATPGQQSSASACDTIHQILCSKSEITALESLRTGQVAKDWDLPICGHGQRILAPNWTSVVKQVEAPVSSFIYRSFHEPVEWFHPPRTSSGKHLSGDNLPSCSPLFVGGYRLSEKPISSAA